MSLLYANITSPFLLVHPTMLLLAMLSDASCCATDVLTPHACCIICSTSQAIIEYWKSYNGRTARPGIYNFRLDLGKIVERKNLLENTLTLFGSNT
jgi:hypothetical protein